MSDRKQDLSDEIGGSTPTFAGSDVDKEDIEGQKGLLRLKYLRFASDTNDRKWLAVWTATVIPFWLFFVLIILWSNTTHYKLSDTVLVTLLGTTTLNVLGLAFIVLRGHFGDNSHKIE